MADWKIKEPTWSTDRDTFGRLLNSPDYTGTQSKCDDFSSSARNTMWAMGCDTSTTDRYDSFASESSSKTSNTGTLPIGRDSTSGGYKSLTSILFPCKSKSSSEKSHMDTLPIGRHSTRRVYNSFMPAGWRSYDEDEKKVTLIDKKTSEIFDTSKSSFEERKIINDSVWYEKKLIALDAIINQDIGSIIGLLIDKLDPIDRSQNEKLFHEFVQCVPYGKHVSNLIKMSEINRHMYEERVKETTKKLCDSGLSKRQANALAIFFEDFENDIGELAIARILNEKK
jgi:hypothetical protein